MTETGINKQEVLEKHKQNNDQPMKEQINDMAKVLNECCNRYDENGNHLGNKCSQCECWDDTNHLCCSYNTVEATALYNAGYRKQKEGEWIEKSEDRDEFYEYQYKCSVCGQSSIICDYEHLNFCPNCGAHMRGGKNE